MGGLFSTYVPAPNPANGLQQLQEQNVSAEQAAYEAQAQIAQDEAARDAQVKAREVHLARENQALLYDASGVQLSGTPMQILEDTRTQGIQEINAIMARGNAQADLLRRKAYITGNEGRAAILGESMDYNTRETANKMASIQNRTTAITGLLNAVADPLLTKGFYGFKNPFAANPTPPKSGTKIAGKP